MAGDSMKYKYKNITTTWIKNACPNSHSIKHLSYYSDNGIKYFVDNKYVLYDYSINEMEVAIWLENTFGGELYMCPRINRPEGIETPDYIFRNEKWDLKTPIGTSNIVIDNLLKNKRKQANNFIIDITNNSLPIKEIIRQVREIYNSPSRDWIKTIIIKKNDKIVSIYTKNESNRNPNGSRPLSLI